MRAARLAASLGASLAVSFAAVAALALGSLDLNRASQAELESIKGVGPALSSAIVDERRRGDFAGWADFMKRVKGVGHASAARFSAAGLTVNGEPYRRP